MLIKYLKYAMLVETVRRSWENRTAACRMAERATTGSQGRGGGGAGRESGSVAGRGRRAPGTT